MRLFFYKYGLYLAWIIALAASLGSIYFGEIKNIEPCSLCWYQRICVYPLAVLLAIATYRDDHQIAFYALALSIIGSVVATIHILYQQLPFFRSFDVCGSSKGCAESPLLFDLIPLTWISLISFLTITLLLFFAKPLHKKSLLSHIKNIFKR